MKSYFANFVGKKPTTIGLPYLMDVYINAESKDDAIQQVHDKYIMVTSLKIQHVPDTTQYEKCGWCDGTGHDIYEDDIPCVKCDASGRIEV